MGTPEQHDASIEHTGRELWETPVVTSCAINDTSKIKSNFAEDPFQGKAGS